MEVISLFSYNIRFTVDPPLTATSYLQCTLATFFSSKPYIDSCLNFLTTPTSFCPQGGRFGEVQP